jgi:hypothetical protein
VNSPVAERLPPGGRGGTPTTSDQCGGGKRRFPASELSIADPVPEFPLSILFRPFGFESCLSLADKDWMITSGSFSWTPRRCGGGGVTTNGAAGSISPVSGSIASVMSTISFMMDVLAAKIHTRP